MQIHINSNQTDTNSNQNDTVKHDFHYVKYQCLVKLKKLVIIHRSIDFLMMLILNVSKFHR